MATATFEDVRLVWSGREYLIPAEKVFAAIGRIENVLSLGDVIAMGTGRSGLKIAKLASAYGELLRFAGANVADEDVYSGMFAENAPANEAAGIVTMIALICPPAVRADLMAVNAASR